MYHFRVNKIVVAVVGLALVGIALYFVLSKKSPDETARSATASGSAETTGSAANAATPAAKGKVVDKVGRVSPEERERLAEQIAKAKANRPASGASGSTSTTPRPELADNGDAKLVRTTMKEAMKEIIPYLAECFDKAGDKVPAEIKVVADMTLTGDPDIGTIIDTNGVTDGDGKPLEPGFDLCLKDALVTIQMPPLSEGGEVKVTYPFLFSRNGPDGSAGSGNVPP